MTEQHEARTVAVGYDDSGDPVVKILAAHNALSDDSDVVSQSLYLLSETIIRGLLPDERGGGLGGEFGYGVNYENDVFAMRRYYWGDCDCGADDSDEPHKSSCSLERPNFLHKRTGQELRWYKWIGRGMEAIPQTIADWGTVFTECWESIPTKARERAESQRQYEATPEFQAEHDAAMSAMMAAMDRIFSEQVPCYQCSMDDNTSMVGGTTQTGAGVKIVKVNLKDDNSCPNCGHVTTDEEYVGLAARQKIMDDDFRASVRRKVSDG